MMYESKHKEINKALGETLYKRKDYYDCYCEEVKLLNSKYNALHEKVIKKVAFELELIRNQEKMLIEQYKIEKYGNSIPENVKFDEEMLKANFYHEKCMDLYFKYCRIVYNKVENLLNSVDIFKEE